MEQITISAQSRQEKGKNPARRLRASGQVPGVLYGPGIEGTLMVSLNAKDLEKKLHTAAGGNVLVNLELESGKKTVMFKEVDRHPMNGTILHVDLLEIALDHTVVVEIPVHLTGKAAGLAFGGIIQQEHRKIRVECLPTSIPDAVDVDITPLGIGQSIHASDLKLPEGVKVIEDAGTTIVSVVAPTAEVAPKTAEEVQAELAKSFAEKEGEAKE